MRYPKIPFPCFLAAALLAVFLAPARAQVFYERDDIMVAVGWKKGEPITRDVGAPKTYADPAWRAKMLQQFPVADADRDGNLTEAEAINFHLRQVRRFTPQGEELKYLDEAHASHWTERAPMRDGKSLPVEIYLPGGQGPWPVVLVRTARGRIDSALDYGNELVRAGYAVIGGDLTPEGDFINADVLGHEVAGKEMSREDRAALNARRGKRNAGEDGADTIAWIAQQPWCNGQIGMNGYSEAAIQTKSALAQRPPALKLTVTAIGSLARTAGSPFAGIGASVDWATGKYAALAGGWKPPAKPALLPVDNRPAQDVFYNDRTGWFDFAGRNSINEWARMRTNGKSTLVMGIGGHGRISKAARMPPDYGDCDLLLPEITAFEWLRGKDPALARSRFYYFLMGDATNPAAPGNVWKVADKWPVTEQEVSWFLQPDRGLATTQPAATAKFDYLYDSHKPVETLNGPHSPSNHYGPRDQRPLDGRDDVLLFTSATLDAPLEITGESWADLYVSSDAPDTQFFVQLLDIYPDGYKWPIRENGIVTRLRDESAEPTPLEPGKVYHLKIPLQATALVLDRGHRLGLQIMSSSYPTYPVHPNTWDAIDSYAQSKPAHQTVHLSTEYPSRIVLPVVPAGTSRDYDPKSD